MRKLLALWILVTDYRSPVDGRCRIERPEFACDIWKIQEIVTVATVALKENSSTTDWSPKLRSGIEKLMSGIGNDASGDSRTAAQADLEACFRDKMSVIRSPMDPAKDLKELVSLIPDARMKKCKNALVVCASAILEDVDDCVVVCLGDLTARKLRKSIIISVGGVESSEVEDSLVFSGKAYSCKRRTKHTTLLVLGKIEIAECEDGVFVNCPHRKVDRSSEDRDVAKVDLPRQEEARDK